MEKQLIEEISDGVATLTFNRPDRLNALSTPITEGLLEAPRERLPIGVADDETGARQASQRLVRPPHHHHAIPVVGGAMATRRHRPPMLEILSHFVRRFKQGQRSSPYRNT